MLDKMIKSVLDMDRASVVICNLEHTIVYMNPAAQKRYAKYGDILGRSLLNCHNEKSCDRIREIVDWFKSDKSNNMIYTYHHAKENKDVYMVALRDENSELIGYYEKHEYRNRETAQIYKFESLI